MAYMSEEGYQKLVAELRRLESVERPKLSPLSQKHAIKVTFQKTPNTMQLKKHRVCLKQKSIS